MVRNAAAAGLLLLLACGSAQAALNLRDGRAPVVVDSLAPAGDELGNKVAAASLAAATASLGDPIIAGKPCV